MTDLKAMTQSIEDLVERGTLAVAEVHKSIARLPFDAIEQVAVLAPPARKVHEVHDGVIDLIYGSVRKVNHAVCGALVSITAEQKPPKVDPAAPRDP